MGDRPVGCGEDLAFLCGDPRLSGVCSGRECDPVSMLEGHSGWCGDNRPKGGVSWAEAELWGLSQCHRVEGCSVLT